MPVYAMGPKDARVKTPMWECPISAVPEWMWQVLDLWVTCRACHALPLPGGVVDQPYVVRRAWPIWEAEMAAIEQQRSAAALLTLLGGGRARG
jgi:hypothetical protein